MRIGGIRRKGESHGGGEARRDCGRYAPGAPGAGGVNDRGGMVGGETGGDGPYRWIGQKT